ncbi:MAG: hypothetical protein ACOYM2_06120, partial [Rectinemataceae bacterium]
ATAIPLPLEESIEGWVARNKSLFSIRMLLNNQYLSSLDEGRSIMAFPIIVAGTPIAVLNIEDIDFVKYNAFTERLIAMLIHLGRDALEASVADERILGPDSIEATTGLARSDRIIAYLDYAIEQAHITSASLSFLIIELGNAALILERYPDLKPDELVKELARRAVGSLPDECRVFRADSGLGIAIVFPGKDRDGAAQFSLEMLGRVGSSGWKMGRDLVRVEPLIGIATLGVGIRSGAVLAGAAAGLLEQQRSRL